MRKIMFKINYFYKTNNQKFNNYNKIMQNKLKNLSNYQIYKQPYNILET